MKVIIVGHGPSILKQNYGDFIDSFDFVIRQKKRGLDLVNTNPKVFGKKINAVCGSVGQHRAIKQKTYETWIFVDSRYENSNLSHLQDCKIDKSLCNEWNKLYRASRSEYKKPDSRITEYNSSDALGHKHLSSGFHTLLYACKFLSPQKVFMLGFDNLSTGKFTWSLARGPEWDQYPDHRWDIEFSMIDLVEKSFNMKVEFL